MRCRAQGTSIVSGCRGGVTITLRRSGKRPLRVGRATFRLDAGRQVRARALLSAAGRRALRGLTHPLLELELSARSVFDPTFPQALPPPPAVGPDLTGRWRVRL